MATESEKPAGLTVQSAIDTTFLDTMHYDVQCNFTNGFEELNETSLVITNVSGLRPFIIKDGSLQTPEFTLEAYVTVRQDELLQELYKATIHPNYVDLRYPVEVSWGYLKDSKLYSCYLLEYEPPDSVNYSSAEILSAKMTLRVIDTTEVN